MEHRETREESGGGVVSRTAPARPPKRVPPGQRSAGATDIPSRGSYLTLEQVTQAYPIFTLRLLRRLVEERRIAFSRAGRRIVLTEADIEGYLEGNRVDAATGIPQRAARL